MNIRIYLVLVISFTTVGATVLEAQEGSESVYQLPRIVIADFSNNSQFKGLEEALTEQMTSLIAVTRRFEVVERSQLEKVLEEQKLGLAGIIDEATAIEVGKILGAEIMVVGSITDAGYSQSEAVNEEEGYVEITWTGRVTVSGRFVDIETGQVILSKVVRTTAEESDTERVKSDLETLGDLLSNIVRGRDPARQEHYRRRGEQAVSRANEDAGISLVRAFFSELPLIGYVIAVQGNEVMVDLGREIGLKSKVNLLVYREGEAVKHPVTGETVTTQKRELGYLQVTDIDDRLSSTKSITDGLLRDIEIGDRVRVIEPVFLGHLSLMSAAIPGLGQMVEGKLETGILFLGVESTLATFAVINAIDANNTNQNRRGEYLNKDEADDAVGRGIRWTIILGVVLAVAKTFDIIDAGFPAEFYDPLALGETNRSNPTLVLTPNRVEDIPITLEIGRGELAANLEIKW